MERRYNLLEAFVGAFVLVVCGAFLCFFYQSSGSSIQQSYKVYALFERIDGLSVGSDIKVSGVKVGKIASLYVDPKTYQAKVEMLLDRTMSLPTDTSAEVESASLLGEKYISLVPGNQKDALTQGMLITDTQSSISFEKLIGKFLFSSGDKK